MVEPLEDTRSELTFVTELVSTSLHNVLLSATGAGARRSERDRHRPPGTEPSGEVDLDEVEIQKGTLQIAKGLGFLHQQAKMVHLNLTPEAVLINAKVSERQGWPGVLCVLRAARPDGEWKSRPAWDVDQVLIPMQGDWKLSGLNLTTPLTQPDGTPTKYTYPEVDHRLPPQVQWKLDYLGEFITLDQCVSVVTNGCWGLAM
jgi:SCY1-like protein 2